MKDLRERLIAATSPLEILLLLKKGLQCPFCFLLPVYLAPTRSSWDKVVAEIGPLFVYNPFRQYFPAIIIRMRIVELALLTAPKVLTTM